MKFIIVEDRKDIQDLYLYTLQKKAVEFEIADSRVEAIKMLKSHSFNGAVVDLQLTDSASFGEGVEVIKFIQKMNEGTNVIVVSGTADPIDVINSYEAYDPERFKFIHKDGDSLTDVIPELLKRAEKNSLRYFGEYPNLNAYLAAPTMGSIWEDQLHQILECGYPIMQDMLHRGFKPLLPILRKNTGAAAFELQKDLGIIIGDFWSKNLGHAIRVVIAKKGNIYEPNPRMKELHSKDFGRKITFTVYKNLHVSREDYVEVLADTPWEKNDNG